MFKKMSSGPHWMSHTRPYRTHTFEKVQTLRPPATLPTTCNTPEVVLEMYLKVNTYTTHTCTLYIQAHWNYTKPFSPSKYYLTKMEVHCFWSTTVTFCCIWHSLNVIFYSYLLLLMILSVVCCYCALCYSPVQSPSLTPPDQLPINRLSHSPLSTLRLATSKASLVGSWVPNPGKKHWMPILRFNPVHQIMRGWG